MNDYKIEYTDLSFRVVTWSDTDFSEVCKLISKRKVCAVVDGSLYMLEDIRNIVKLDPLPQEKPEEEPVQPQETGAYDFVDFQTKQWLLHEAKIDIDKGGLLEDEY
jgi:hypothetical protein